jgi:hypothetical protein
MENKKFNPIDLLKGLDYNGLDQTTVETYEQHIIKIMIYDKCMLSEALDLDFQMNMLDKECVFDLVEYLEEQLVDLHKVAFYMDVYTGRINDFHLTIE